MPDDALGVRLRQLRKEGWSARLLSQLDLGQALEVSVPLISSWENGKAVPSLERLEQYARLFATDGPSHEKKLRIPQLDELSGSAQAAYEQLRDELLGLRGHTETANGAQRTPLKFPDGEAITIVCSELPERLRSRMPYASLKNPDYVSSYRFADLDALIELLLHIGGLNPSSPIKVGLGEDLRRDDLTAHVVALGGIDFNPVLSQFLHYLRHVPVRQQGRDTQEERGGLSVTMQEGGLRELRPELLEHDGEATLAADVAHFLRAPNPFNRARTLTFFYGMYSRGSYGVVRALTDPTIKERNTNYLAQRFGGEETYSLVCRVEIVLDQVVTPDWTVDTVRLHEWPYEAATRH